MMHAPYTIREAGVSDIQLIRELCEQVWPATYAPILSKEQLSYMMEWMYSPASLQRQMNEGCQFLLLLLNDNVCIQGLVFFLSGTPRCRGIVVEFHQIL